VRVSTPAPQDLATDPSGFGRAESLEWADPGFAPRQIGLLSAAYTQHLAALAVKARLQDRRLTLTDLAAALGQDEDQLRRKLHGQVFSTLGEICAWEHLLGPGIVPSTITVPKFTVADSTGTEDPDKRIDGRYLTASNPFFHSAFLSWFAQLGATPLLLEPFAGANALPRMMRAIGLDGTWGYFDIAPLAPEVVQQDTLANFPAGYDAVVTNPPYLSRHFARRKGLEVDHLPWGEYNNLYKVSLERCLANTGYVAAIIPESFLTTGIFTERLVAVVSLTTQMFNDTDMPTCLALWGPTPQSDFEVWRGTRLLGMYRSLAQQLDMPECASRITFNDPAGLIGLKAIDGTTGPTIAFVPASEIPIEKIKHSARLVSRIRIDDLGSDQVDAVIAAANKRLNAYRVKTGDVLLTAFKGLRNDGEFRRRLDFDTARRVLAAGLDDVEGR